MKKASSSKTLPTTDTLNHGIAGTRARAIGKTLRNRLVTLEINTTFWPSILSVRKDKLSYRYVQRADPVYSAPALLLNMTRNMSRCAWVDVSLGSHVI